MNGKFEVGKQYKCISTCGASPSFEELEITMNGVSLFNYMNDDIYIENPIPKSNSVTRHKYINGVVDFCVGYFYTVRSLSPLTFYGQVRFPVQEPSRNMKGASVLLTKFMQGHNLPTSRSIVHAVLNVIEWDIEHSWDGSYIGIGNIIKKCIEDLAAPYTGSCNGYGVSNEQKHFMLSVFTPVDYDVAVNIPDDLLPRQLSVSVEDGRALRILVEDGVTILDWYKQLIEPK